MSEGRIKKILPRSLLGRSMMILVTPVLIIQAFTTFMFFDRHWDTVTERMAYALAGEVAIIADRYEVAPSSDSVRMVTDYASDYLDIEVRFEPGGTVEIQKQSYIFWAKIVADSLTHALNDRLDKPHNVRLSLAEKWVEIEIQLDNGVLHASAPIRRLFSSSSYIFLMWRIGSSIMMLVIAIIFMRNQIRPIRKLAVAAERFGKGQDVLFLKPSGAREVRAAARAFLTMKERLDRQIQQRTSMLAGVSHDLRTPLTRMKIELEMMGEKEDVSNLKQDLEDMERMINAYLEFVRGEGDEELQRVDLKDFVEGVVDGMLRSDHAIQCSIEEGISMMLRPVAFQRCLNNLIGNALKYADNVWIDGFRTQQNTVLILVEDDGPGVDEAQYDDLFKPFFRVESSRNAKTGGIGLGLPIAQDIVNGHGGDISLDKGSKGGLRVRIELPL